MQFFKFSSDIFPPKRLCPHTEHPHMILFSLLSVVYKKHKKIFKWFCLPPKDPVQSRDDVLSLTWRRRVVEWNIFLILMLNFLLISFFSRSLKTFTDILCWDQAHFSRLLFVFLVSFLLFFCFFVWTLSCHPLYTKIHKLYIKWKTVQNIFMWWVGF